MPKAKTIGSAAAVLAIAASVAINAGPASAQDAEALKSETARIEAQAELERARADRERAAAERISALGLPSYEGRTTLNQGAGSMEATMLASYAVDAAAFHISRRVAAADNPGGSARVIVLAGDEALDFGRAGMMHTELNAISDVFGQLGTAYAAPEAPSSPGQPQHLEAGGSASAVIAAASAAAGLLRSNTEVTALDLAGISNRVLATAVAARVPNSILPSAAIGNFRDLPPSATGWRGMSLFQKYTDLLERRRRIQAERDAIVLADPTKPTDRHKALTAALTRFDTAAARITTADANGIVPLAQAMRLEVMGADNPRVLRVYVDRAGGSMVNRTNLLTTLGMSDPVRVSGGMFVSYVLTDPAEGRLLAGDVITCRTASTRLSSVHRGIWRNASTGTASASCVGRAGDIAEASGSAPQQQR